MLTDRTFIWIAQAFYAISGVLTLDRLRRHTPAPHVHPLNYATMLCGFALHTLFLYWRGQALHQCPLTNAFEMTVFIAWAAVLFYLMIGPSYRVSFLGAFTAPVVLAICLVALLGINDVPRTSQPPVRSPWVDFHAAIGIVACGAFTLAFVCGAMYLHQERQLRTHRLSPSFMLLPSIEQLEVITYRLIVLGFIMLTAGMVGGIISSEVVGHWTVPKLVWAWTAWLLYAAMLGARRVWSLRGRRVVLDSMVVFVVVLLSYWAISLLGGFYWTPA